ncbi:GntR family transcriptional regulator [Lentzea sp. NBRC 105346]|uniref:aminotransferase-like domain-containing protein n=1 Tax=Lentzea sp. NBRC 105346 TaxID=3032205 RepID=UPI0024A01D72|nr:PLP-dependent aminotransferase family protein [Lentzea sp. NBRC 105346]GLZ30007.1 GntR family transcriptional regulator [Lentzea sp. NBRC 105346]
MDFRVIADRIASDIASGVLRPGEKLLPQRTFARRHNLAPSTVARVYGELVRRGLAVGEVGRGTFIRAATDSPELPLAEPATLQVDLELNFPVVPQQTALISTALNRMLRPDVLATSLSPVGVTGTPQARLAASHLIPLDRRFVFTGNGRQAIAAAIAALVPAGERLGVERLTYSVVKGIAARLGVQLVPLPVDDEGLVPQGFDGVRAVYLQPALHNPLGASMSRSRRAAVVSALQDNGIYAIEDRVNSFLHDEPLLDSPRTVVVDSLSKRVAPGLTLGIVAAPAEVADRVVTAVRSGGWAAQRFALDAAAGLVNDGTVASIVALKRQDAATRQAIAGRVLDGFTVRRDVRAYHLWWELPDPWRAETFVAAAARRGIAVTPAAAFAVGSRTPNAVRLALASPPLELLESALTMLASLARSAPDAVD